MNGLISYKRRLEYQSPGNLATKKNQRISLLIHLQTIISIKSIHWCLRPGLWTCCSRSVYIIHAIVNDRYSRQIVSSYAQSRQQIGYNHQSITKQNEQTTHQIWRGVRKRHKKKQSDKKNDDCKDYLLYSPMKIARMNTIRVLLQKRKLVIVNMCHEGAYLFEFINILGTMIY